MLAVEKWKRAWDADIDIQYPPTGSPTGLPSVRRVGFCRDAVHFYFLAMQFLTNSRALNWRGEPDTRMAFVMTALKQIRSYVASEAYKNGSDIGSVVAIDDHYGVDDLTLDMKLLFAPLPLKEMEAEGSGVHNIDGLLQ
jgi:hypothetical protein